MLERTMRWLRALGADVLWERGWTEAEVLKACRDEGRVLLTRARRLADAAGGLWLTRDDWREQVREVVRRFHLEERPFTRCTVCNTLLREVPADDVRSRVDERVLLHWHAFWECGGCGRVYWQGAHYQRMHATVRALLR